MKWWFRQQLNVQIIFFAIVMGVTLLSMGSRGNRLAELANDGAELMLRMTQFVMKLAPYGILALVANLVASVGADLLPDVGKFIVAQYLSLAILMTVVDPAVLRFLARVSPWRCNALQTGSAEGTGQGLQETRHEALLLLQPVAGLE